MEIKTTMTDEEYCKKYDVRCKCGEQSVIFDSWFNYFPCKYHKYLSASEYSRKSSIAMSMEVRKERYDNSSGILD